MESRKLPTPTSQARIEQGFSLIEILVVIALMALITGVFIPSLTGAFRVRGEAYVRKLALVLGQARDRALLTDKLIRLKVDLDNQTLTLEEAPSSYLVPKTPERPPSEREREELAKQETETFHIVTELMKEPSKLPSDLKVIQVTSPRLKRPATEGVVMVYFFNNGSNDGAKIFFETEEKVHQAITLHPITGLSKIEPIGPEAAR